MWLDREDMEKTCSTRYGNAMKGHTSVPFRSFRALINLNNFVLRQLTLIILDWLGGDQRPKHHKRLLFTRDRTASSSL